MDKLVTGDVFSLLEEEIASGASYDVVWLQNILEHVLDPVSLLKSLRKLVSPEGLAVVTVPNDCSVTQQELMNMKYITSPYWIAPPDHLSYFDYKSLINIGEFTGWNCKDIHGDFPVEWFLFHPGSNYINDKSFGKDVHKARVQIENLISQQPIECVNEFWHSIARVGMGRCITAFYV